MSTLNESNVRSIASNYTSNSKKDRSVHSFQQYIDAKLEKYNAQLLESIDKKFFYLTNKDHYLQVQKDEIAKLIQKLNPIGNNLQNYQTLFKLNEFFTLNPELTAKIRNQFADFLNLNISNSTNRYILSFVLS